MAKDPAVKAKSSDETVDNVEAAVPGKRAATNLTTPVPSTTGHGPIKNPPVGADAAIAVVQFYKVDGQRLEWVADSVASVTASTNDLCGGDTQTCPHTITQPSNSQYVDLPVRVTPRTMVRIETAVRRRWRT
jgi:hypothetical protein